MILQRLRKLGLWSLLWWLSPVERYDGYMFSHNNSDGFDQWDEGGEA